MLFNMTCSIYRPWTFAWAATGVPCFIKEDFPIGKETAGERTGELWFTHIMYVALSVDIRDRLHVPNQDVDDNNTDWVFIPSRSGVNLDSNSSGVKYFVVWVERSAWGSPEDYKTVYLRRIAGSNITWPTQYT